jgi:putative membrane protein
MSTVNRNTVIKGITSLAGISTLILFVAAPGLSQVDRPVPVNVAQDAPAETDDAATPAEVTALDREFIVMAAQGNNAEIQTSQLALERATDEAVQQYAQQMIDEHTAANQELEPLAAERGVELPTTPSSFDAAVLERLSQVPEAEFDRAYMDAQVNAHLKSLGVFRTGALQVEDPALQNYARTLLPRIGEHLEMAQAMVEGENTGAQ